MRISVASPIILALVASACIELETVDADVDQLDPEAQDRLDVLLACQATGDDCSEEHRRLLEYAEELADYLDGQVQVEAGDVFRATVIADCSVGSDVSCTGFSCIATDDVGCSCTNKMGLLVDVKACSGGGGNPCGNGVCDAGETYSTCAQDCPCGNGICGGGESYFNCPQDCTCGNGVCDFNETSFTCGVDCDSCIELGFGGQCSNRGPCCNWNSDCAGIGIGYCYMY